MKKWIWMLALCSGTWANAQDIEWAVQPTLQYEPHTYTGFKNGLAVISGADNKKGLIDTNGKIVVQPIYEMILIIDEGVILFHGKFHGQYREDPGYLTGTWSFLDKNLKCIIPENVYYSSEFLNDVTIFSEGLAVVSTWHGKNKEGNSNYHQDDQNEGTHGIEGISYGFIDVTGKKVVTPKYKQVTDFKNGFAFVKKNDKWGWINRKGVEMIIPKYTSINYQSVQNGFCNGLAVCEKDYKSVLVDTLGNEIVPAKYETIWLRKEQDLINVVLQNRHGLIDFTGKEIVAPKYLSIRLLSEGLAVFTDENRKYGLVNKIGKEIIAPKYSYIGDFSEGLAVFTDEKGENSKYGLIDRTGKVIMAFKYSSIYNFSEGFATFQGENGKYGVIDRTGKEIIPSKYSYIGYFSEGIAKFQENFRDGLIDTTGKIVVSNYSVLDHFVVGLVIFQDENGKFGLMDTKGKKIIAPIFDAIHPKLFTETLIWVKTKTGWGAIKKPIPKKEVPTNVTLHWYQPRESAIVGKTLHVQQPTLPIDLEVKSSIALSREDFQVFLNEQPYQPKIGETDLQNNSMNNGAYYQTFSEKITFSKAGFYKIQVKVVKNGQLLGESLPIQIEFKPDEPIHLWILSVGAKSNLRWTTADAQDFGQLFQKQAGEGRLYRQVTAEILTDENADVSGILKQLNRIKTQFEKGQLTSKDMIILFFSAHGDNLNGTFYLQPTRYVRENPEKTGISWADIESILKGVSCKKLLFLDACKSGTIKADPKRVLEARNQQIKARDGWAIFTSSDVELSYEDDAWQNGSFTEAIVEGLVQGKADKNADQIITTQELAEFVAKRVLQLNEKANHGLQYPQFKNKLPTDLPLFEIGF